MNHNASTSNLIFIDRPMNQRPAAAGRTPSLWMLCKDDLDFTDAALRVFLMLCLLVSLALCGLSINGTSEGSRGSNVQLSVGKLPIHPSLPNVSFSSSIR